MSEAWTIPKYSVKALDMWPLPQAGSHTDILARSSPVPLSFSHKARVAHGGVGKSSRLSRASKRWDITAWDVFCLIIVQLSPRLAICRLQSPATVRLMLLLVSESASNAIDRRFNDVIGDS